MKIIKKLSLALFFALTIISASFASVDIENAVNDSVKNLLPKDSNWKVSVPPFIEINEETNIDVFFAEDSTVRNLVAQVWVKNNDELKLYAVPIEVLSLGNNSVKLTFKK